MIYSRVRHLKFKKEERDGEDLTYEVIQAKTGLNPNTISRLLSRKPITRIDAATLDAVCKFFECSVGDVLEYVPEGSAPPEGAEASE